jgi:hypothetical protein
MLAGGCSNRKNVYAKKAMLRYKNHWIKKDVDTNNFEKKKIKYSINIHFAYKRVHWRAGSSAPVIIRVN